MASATFHPFAKLPLELRLQIWEAACLPSSKHHRGLHYMDIEAEELENRGAMIVLRCDWSSPPEKRDPISLSNRSAYLWDGGLWRACKESRKVIVHHSHVNDWFRIQRICEDEHKWLGDQNGDWIGGDEAVPPSELIIQEDGEEWHLMVYPVRDVFCISASDWASLPSLEHLTIQVPFVGYDGDIYSFPAKNLALEFDSSWNLNWDFGHDDLWDLREEESPRGLLANMLADVARDPDFLPKLWLIDKSARWIARPGQDLSTVYHDCDSEYVEISCKDTRSGTTKYASRGAVTEFMEKLGRVCDWEYNNEYRQASCCCPCLGYLDDPFEVEKYVRILVRRDNEVGEFTNEDDNSVD
ncbi:hypothetical protein FSARC_5411 [Fusarium sarcochroum]|uniref:2EXR domain-containing protein n=1 Tax=Fusarium sarcochroum TaxID=1208366 RepID=A0A8H4TZK3_9HYPO|nr:hypothetical protein FSARC_5411 [Fusarium sarcochroum]